MSTAIDSDPQSSPEPPQPPRSFPEPHGQYADQLREAVGVLAEEISANPETVSLDSLSRRVLELHDSDGARRALTIIRLMTNPTPAQKRRPGDQVTLPRAVDTVRVAVEQHAFAALYKLVVSNKIDSYNPLVTYMKRRVETAAQGAPDEKRRRLDVTPPIRQLQSAASAADNPTISRVAVDSAIQVRTGSGWTDAAGDVVLVAENGTVVVRQIKVVQNPRLQNLKDNVSFARAQLTGDKGEIAPPGSLREVELVVEPEAPAGLRQTDAGKLRSFLRELDIFQDLLDKNGDLQVDFMRVTLGEDLINDAATRGIVIPSRDLDPARTVSDPDTVDRQSGVREPPRPAAPPQSYGAPAREDQPSSDGQIDPCVIDDTPSTCPRPEIEKRLFDVPGNDREAHGPLAEAAAMPEDTPGGIDFSTMTLRYLSDGTSGQPTRYAFSAYPARDGRPGDRDVATNAQRSSDAFFVWLSLPRSAFWVNLNPLEPKRVIDADLGKTDVGRVLLESDLELKRTLARLTEPGTPTGQRFWQHPGAEDFLRYCGAVRAWIVPGTAQVRERYDAVLVEQAPLVVRTERSDVGPTGTCTPPPPEALARQESLLRSVALPELQRQVDEAPAFSSLRQVYFARVAAEWYRQRSASRPTEFAHLIDSGDISRWPSTTRWSPQEVFARYNQSFAAGEYAPRTVSVGDDDWTVTFGGINLDVVPIDHLRSPAEPEIIDAVDEASDRQTHGPGRELWLGSTNESPLPPVPWAWIIAGGLTVLVAVIGLGRRYLRRRRQVKPRQRWNPSSEPKDVAPFVVDDLTPSATHPASTRRRDRPLPWV